MRIFLGDTHNFFNTGHALKYLERAVVSKRLHTVARRDLLDGSAVCPLHDQASNVILHGEQFVDTCTSSVAEVVTRIAAAFLGPKDVSVGKFFKIFGGQSDLLKVCI